MAFNIDVEKAIVVELVSDLEGNANVQIELNETGWMSRAYIVNSGKYVFKFARRPEVKDDYRSEVKIYRLLENQQLSIQVPKILWVSDKYEYIGYEGVVGSELRDIQNELDAETKIHIGITLGTFLKKLHSLELDGLERISLEDEILLLGQKYTNLQMALKELFSLNEISILNNFVKELFPTKIQSLGIEPVMCHGDIGYGNLIMKKDGFIGVIDFGDLGYYDASQDFCAIQDQVVLESALKSYGANDILNRKIALRASIIAFRDLEYNLKLGNKAKINTAIEEIKKNLTSGKYE